ncbi:alpha-2-macroglobulin family protein [Tropicimonas sp.]|uniref:alpha-2-macroglobulin family protein n=1 Tax=Tropicimonas sp. TaxID=2067044 RepID=UPI003A893E85
MPGLRRLVIPLVAGLCLAQPVFAQASDAPIPERRLIYERDTDFFGADLSALFDTTLGACRAACLTDPSCSAFTFNGRSNSCFPKKGVTRRDGFEGAVSAIVVDTTAAALDIAATRAAELDFLRPEDFEAARAQAETMAQQYVPGPWSLEEIAASADAARGERAYGEQMRWLGAAVVLSDSAGHWEDYSLAARNDWESDKDNRTASRDQALSAAINAYLRSATLEERTEALVSLGYMLEAVGRGRDSVFALGRAGELTQDSQVAEALGRARALYGFRITDHRVESDPAVPRVCATFSEALAEGVDFEPFLQLPGNGFAVEASERDLCIDGMEHGQRYRIAFRAGLPAASGETLGHEAELQVYIRDRSPLVRFPGRAYVLPRVTGGSLPVVTVNLATVELTLNRISERNIVTMIREGTFGQPVRAWEEDAFGDGPAEVVWRGTGEVETALNTDVTTLLPMAEAIGDQPPGLYALQARVPGADPYETPPATQWFVISDIGLASMQGTDGLHVFARSLASAEPMEGLELSLLSRSNRILGTVATDARGYARFAPGLVAGRGGAAPATVLARMGDDDTGFLSLTDPEFDLSDRGVEGRPAAGPIDAFLATDRGAYRAGETIHATVLARDGSAKAIPDLPLTAVLSRPDGVEYSRLVSDGGVAGGHVFALPLGPAVLRGTWRLAIHADPGAPALTTRTLLVEDFLPERIDVALSLPETPMAPGSRPALEVSAEYLFGAPGGDLPIEGEVRLAATDALAGYPGYRFGLYDEPFSPALEVIEAAHTDAAGRAVLPLDLPEAADALRPLEATVTVRVSEGSGRPVERQVVRPLAPSGPLIGIRPGFDDVLPEGAEATFGIVGIGAGLVPEPMRVKWTLNRVETRYQWYSANGNWDWEPVTRRTRVDRGELMLAATPATLSAPVEWGHYELVVERIDGPYSASSVDFHAGWYAPADASATPDLLEVSLDRAAYLPGEVARLRIVAPDAGKALVTVASNRLIAMDARDLAAGENMIDLPVTDEWGAGAYVTATLIRPMETATGRNPARSIGLVHAAVDPGASRLAVRLVPPAEAAPRERLTATLAVDGIAPGETAWATVAAVDQGILNLTGFTPPSASGYYFGQRKLGMGLRDLYGRLIDGRSGNAGRLRSGGDAEAQARLNAPPPTEALVAFFSGPVQVGADGRAEVGFEMPAFNGQVRLMVLAWTDSAVGEADATVLVRDPVVMTASVPRFLAPGDESRLRLELVHVTGPAGGMALEASAQGVVLDTSALPPGITLADGGKAVLSLPFRAENPGLATISLVLVTPEGRRLDKTLTLPVEANDPVTATASRFSLAPGETATLDGEVLAGLRPGTRSAMLALGPLGRLNAPGLLAELDRYPYGCTEQVTSKALPLLYLSQVADAMGLEGHGDIAERVGGAIDRVLSRQSSAGGFGLWNTDDGDFWLDAYVSDFLGRARAQGYEVPDTAFAAAMDNLRNRLNYAGDFEKGGEDIAYALLVLAREGAAAIGDLRYYADVKGADFATPMASAQLGAALAMYGEQARADAMFRRAVTQLLPLLADEPTPLWRADYGTNLRDSAAVLSLAVEAGSETVDRPALTERIASADRQRSTQESAWTLLAAHALIDAPGTAGVVIDGVPYDLPVLRLGEDRLAAAPVAVTNASDHPLALMLTSFGIAENPDPRALGQGYAIERSYFTMEGAAADPAQVAQGTRLVAVLTVTPFGPSEARLMVVDPLPAGFEIDNPSLVQGGDIRNLPWLKTAATRTAEFRQDRFMAAVDWRSEKPFTLAYVVRAVSPGTFRHPAASVEDMYRPQFRGRSSAGSVVVTR